MKFSKFLVAFAFLLNGFTSAMATQGSSCSITNEQLDLVLHELFEAAQRNPELHTPLDVTPPQNCNKSQFEAALKNSYSRRVNDQQFRELTQLYFRNQNRSSGPTLRTAQITETNALH